MCVDTPESFCYSTCFALAAVRRGVLSSQRGRTRKVIRKGDMTTSKTYARTTGNAKLLFGPGLLALACIVIAFTAGCGGGGSNAKITVQIIPGTTQMIDTGQSLPLRGSDNQRLVTLTPLGKERFRLFDRAVNPSDRRLDVMFDDLTGEVWFAGIPSRGDFGRLAGLLSASGHKVTTTEDKR